MCNLSIIIAYHNEGQDFLVETIESLSSTIDVENYELIIIDDCSDIPLNLKINPLLKVRIIRHKTNLGVGAAFDTGVKSAKSKNIFLMGCDVRFTNNSWASKMIKEIESHPKSLICTAVVPLQKKYPKITFDIAKENLPVDLYKGAFIKYFLKEHETGKTDILEASWMPRELLMLRRSDYIAPTESYEVPCILGAAYGVKKSWYNYINGFWGHKFWGTLEPYISLKSWLFGGNCLVAPHIETAHIFNEPGESGGHGNEDKYATYKNYNRILVAWLLFPVADKDALIDWLKETELVKKAKKMIASDMDNILKKRKEYTGKTVVPISEIVKKSNI
jgi:glycosyltransferase involved in cell wall biosynthesis